MGSTKIEVNNSRVRTAINQSSAHFYWYILATLAEKKVATLRKNGGHFLDNPQLKDNLRYEGSFVFILNELPF